MKCKAIKESELRERMAALGRFLEDYDLPPELKAKSDELPDVIEAACMLIMHYRAHALGLLEKVARKSAVSGDSAFKAASKAVQDSMTNGNNERALAAAVFAGAVALNKCSNTLDALTGREEIESLRAELERTAGDLAAARRQAFTTKKGGNGAD